MSSVCLPFLPLEKVVLETVAASLAKEAASMKSNCVWYTTDSAEMKKQGASCVGGFHVCREECLHHLCWECLLH